MEQYLEYEALQQIGELSAEGVIIYNIPQRKVLYGNAIARELLHLRHDEQLRSIESLLDLVVLEDRDYLKNCISNIWNTRVGTAIELRLRKFADEQVHITVNAFLLSGKEDVVVHLRDITKHRAHEKYLVEYGAKKNTLLDTLAHQINGALMLARNLTTEAEKSIGENGVNMRKYFAILNENNKHCLQIIGDLLHNEHFESPNIFVKPSRADVVEIVSYIFEELNQSYSNRKFSLTHTAPSILAITDEVKLLQIVNNLASNALKFSRNETVVSIDVSENADNVTVSVRDQGIGIPEKLKPLIFEKHSGAGRTGLNGERSSGVGLSICKHLTELIGGKIWFESQEGKGSTFYLSLPKSSN